MKFDGNLILIAFSRDSACEPDALIQTNVPFSGRKSRIVNGSLSGFFLCALNKQIYHEAPFKMHIDRQIPQQQFIFVHTSFILA